MRFSGREPSFGPPRAERRIGTDLKTFRGKVEPDINKALRGFTMKGREMRFALPNTQPWNFAGELSANGEAITGVLSSAQGGVPVTFRKR